MSFLVVVHNMHIACGITPFLLFMESFAINAYFTNSIQIPESPNVDNKYPQNEYSKSLLHYM